MLDSHSCLLTILIAQLAMAMVACSGHVFRRLHEGNQSEQVLDFIRMGSHTLDIHSYSPLLLIICICDKWLFDGFDSKIPA